MYKYYGGKGVKLSEEWNDFTVFLKDMLPTWKPGLTIDRENSNGDYCKDNCRWMDDIGQANNKSNNRIVEYRGKSMTLSELVRNHCKGVKYATVLVRLGWGWTTEEAIGEKLRDLKPGMRLRKSHLATLANYKSNNQPEEEIC